MGSPDIRIFRSKIHELKVETGILIAANGITGTPDNLRAGHDVIRNAYSQDGMYIIVITKTELESLSHIGDLIVLLQDKMLDITMGAISF